MRAAKRVFMENSELSQIVCPRFQGAEWGKMGPFLHIVVLWAALFLPGHHTMSDWRPEGLQPVRVFGKEASDFIN